MRLRRPALGKHLRSALKAGRAWMEYVASANVRSGASLTTRSSVSNSVTGSDLRSGFGVPSNSRYTGLSVTSIICRPWAALLA